MTSNNSSIRCHYEVLGVAQDADAATIKKHHRKMALKYHPDKNLGDDSAAEQFRLIQQAYECLSDPQERKWYDDHRDAILAGWTSGGGGRDGDDMAAHMVFDVAHYMHPGCYSGYHDKDGGFYQVYKNVFEEIVQLERKGQSEQSIELPTDFGTSASEWKDVLRFYQIWESFVSALNFAWEDKYNSREDAPDRRIRRLMEEENKKARRAAKKVYNQDILALVAFVKRRDPRVKAKQQEMEQKKLQQKQKQKEYAAQIKKEQKKAKEAWMEEAQQAMQEAEEADRLAGRVRLADLEDDYDYGGGKKKRGKGKKKKNRRRAQEESDNEEEENEEAKNDNGPTLDDSTPQDGGDDEAAAALELNENEQDGETGDSKDAKVEASPPAAEEPEIVEDDMYFESEEESEEEEPDVWRCECCRKDFKSEGQMENHMKSKKHKEAFKKYQAKMKKKEDQLMADLMDEAAI